MPTGVRSAEPDRVSVAGPEPSFRSVPALGRPPIFGERYRLNRLLHQSSAVFVWHAVRSDGNEFAIKIASLEADRARLRREHDILARVSHPAICRVEEWIDTATQSAAVLEYLPGGDMVSLAGAPPRHWAVALGDLAGALAFLHAHGLVHRDVKARNVLFDAANQARLADFGSCGRIGSPWSAGGTTVEHRPPAWSGRTQTAGDDVYAFAVLAHELIHGQLPSATGPRRHPPSGAESVESLQGLTTLVVETLRSTPDECPGNLAAFVTVIEWLIAEACDASR